MTETEEEACEWRRLLFLKKEWSSSEKKGRSRAETLEEEESAPSVFKF